MTKRYRGILKIFYPQNTKKSEKAWAKKEPKFYQNLQKL